MSLLRPFHTILRAPSSQAYAAAFTTRPFLSATASGSIRSYHSSPVLRLPYKDDQDRESLKPRSTEGTKSSTDDSAAQTDAAFDPSKTRPEEEHAAAGREKGSVKQDGGNPLDMSGANHEVSKPLGEQGGEMKDTTKGVNTKASRSGSPEKKGRP